LVGYTNAGKSTLMNRITGAEVQAKDRLFDTLDTTTRKIRLEEAGEILLSDTVGFIQRLPHHLVEAFKSTLEELTYADLLIHVIDASNPLWDKQTKVVDKLIAELGAENTPRLEVFNKSDICTDEALPQSQDKLRISAKTGAGCDALTRRIAEILLASSKPVTLLIPYPDAGVLDSIYQHGEVLFRTDGDDGIVITATVNDRVLASVEKFMV